MGKIRVLLADDHTVVRRGIRALLEGGVDIEVVAEAKDGREAISYVIGVLGALGTQGMNWANWVNAAIGLWLLISGIWVLGPRALAIRWNQIITGILAGAISLWAALAEESEAK